VPDSAKFVRRWERQCHHLHGLLVLISQSNGQTEAPEAALRTEVSKECAVLGMMPDGRSAGMRSEGQIDRHELKSRSPCQCSPLSARQLLVQHNVGMLSELWRGSEALPQPGCTMISNVNL
jgi:hypothetical protein